MLALITIDEISVIDIGVLFALATYAVREGLDVIGWSRSSRTLRKENEDLIRRNEELEKTTARLATDTDTTRAAMTVLEEKVHDLEGRDQKSVLEALTKMNIDSEERHGRSLAVLLEIRDELKIQTQNGH